MKRQLSVVSLLVSTAVGLGLVASAGADNRGRRQEVVRAVLVGYTEVPAQSVPGRGFFRAVIDEDAGTITYTLSYEGRRDHAIAPALRRASYERRHQRVPVHEPGQQRDAPSRVPRRRPRSAESSRAPNVLAIAAQGMEVGNFAELLAAIRSGNVYVNIHTPTVPAGEIRGQVF